MEGRKPGGPQAISMHQPWASLLVYGIKRIEGRNWPTEHRGRLWIHATAQAPTPQTIKETEENFAQFWAMEGATPVFPTVYPTSALVGCVDILDCLKIETIEAWEELPASVRAEVGSPFGFLCEKPRRLVVPQRMSGFHKIWPLPSKLAQDLEPALKPAPQVGKQPWSWTKYRMTPERRNASLPPSANRDKWSSRYITSPPRQREASHTYTWNGSDAGGGTSSRQTSEDWRQNKSQTHEAGSLERAHSNPAPPPVNAWVARSKAPELMKPRIVALNTSQQEGDWPEPQEDDPFGGVKRREKPPPASTATAPLPPPAAPQEAAQPPEIEWPALSDSSNSSDPFGGVKRRVGLPATEQAPLQPSSNPYPPQSSANPNPPPQPAQPPMRQASGHPSLPNGSQQFIQPGNGRVPSFHSPPQSRQLPGQPGAWSSPQNRRSLAFHEAPAVQLQGPGPAGSWGHPRAGSSPPTLRSSPQRSPPHAGAGSASPPRTWGHPMADAREPSFRAASQPGQSQMVSRAQQLDGLTSSPYLRSLPPRQSPASPARPPLPAPSTSSWSHPMADSKPPSLPIDDRPQPSSRPDGGGASFPAASANGGPGFLTASSGRAAASPTGGDAGQRMGGAGVPGPVAQKKPPPGFEKGGPLVQQSPAGATVGSGPELHTGAASKGEAAAQPENSPPPTGTGAAAGRRKDPPPGFSTANAGKALDDWEEVTYRKRVRSPAPGASAEGAQAAGQGGASENGAANGS